jgi:hypothetical protein
MASRGPSRWIKAVAVVLAVVMPLALWEKRGLAIGAVALLVYGTVFLAFAFNRRAVVEWSRQHVALDAFLIVPLTFLGLAYLTELRLALCIAIALMTTLALVPLAVWRRGAQHRPDDAEPVR